MITRVSFALILALAVASCLSRPERRVDIRMNSWSSGDPRATGYFTMTNTGRDTVWYWDAWYEDGGSAPMPSLDCGKNAAQAPHEDGLAFDTGYPPMVALAPGDTLEFRRGVDSGSVHVRLGVDVWWEHTATRIARRDVAWSRYFGLSNAKKTQGPPQDWGRHRSPLTRPDKYAEPILTSEPVWPDSASTLNGSVLVEITVSANGEVVAARIVRSDLPPAFDDPVLAAAKQWRFEPARDADGNPLPSKVAVSFAPRAEQ